MRLELPTVPFHRALHRPNLVLGGERELVMFTGLIAVCLILAAQGLAAVLTGILLWFGCLGLLRYMAKIDPYLSQIYLKSLKYRRYYAARSKPFCQQ